MPPSSSQGLVRKKRAKKRREAEVTDPQTSSQKQSSDVVNFNELKGKIVFAPAEHFGIEVPGMFYRVRVTRRDTRRRDAVVIRFFEDDGSQYWLPMEQVVEWMRQPNNPDGQCTHKETDEYAAKSLLDLKSQCSAERNTTEIDETDVSVSNVLLEMSAMEADERSHVKPGERRSQTSGSPVSVGTEVQVREDPKRS